MNIPGSVGRGSLDPELKAWLPKGPTLGADVTIAVEITRCLPKGLGLRSALLRLSFCLAQTGPWQFASTRRPVQRVFRLGRWCISMAAASPTGRLMSSRYRCASSPSVHVSSPTASSTSSLQRRSSQYRSMRLSTSCAGSSTTPTQRASTGRRSPSVVTLQAGT